MAKYDYLIVGAGLFGSTFAQKAAEKGKRCLVIDKRDFLSGNLHCQEQEGIPVHRYGPHIFHTSSWEIWSYVNRFARFNYYVDMPIAQYKYELYNLPLNMNTFSRLWGTCTPAQAQARLEEQKQAEHIETPRNLEERALKLYGRDIYEKFIQGYMEKRWHKDCRELSPALLEPLALRFTYDNRFFSESYQGVPSEGYDVMIARMLAGCEVRLGTEYMGFGRAYPDIAEKTVFTGMIDEFFYFRLGALEYSTLSYEYEVMDTRNYQGCAVMHHTDREVPYTRTIEYKHLVFGQQSKTVIGRELPVAWRSGLEPYFPARDEKNRRLYEAYRALSMSRPDVIFAGRLGTYQYYSMEETVRMALDLAKRELRE